MKKIIDRNTLHGFARRTRRNLEFILKCRRTHANDVHEVTQLTTSLLGLVVFPYEKLKMKKGFGDLVLPELYARGWPQWNIERDTSQKVDDLIYHLRNAISHGNIHFHSDSRELAEVDIELWDRPSRRAPKGWRARINGAQLLDFTRRLADLLDSARAA